MMYRHFWILIITLFTLHPNKVYTVDVTKGQVTVCEGDKLITGSCGVIRSSAYDQGQGQGECTVGIAMRDQGDRINVTFADMQLKNPKFGRCGDFVTLYDSATGSARRLHQEWLCGSDTQHVNGQLQVSSVATILLESLIEKGHRGRWEVAYFAVDASTHLPTITSACLHLSDLRCLMDQHGANVDEVKRDGSNQTCLHVAAKAGKLEVADFLLGQHQADPDTVDSEAWTALHHAARGGHREVVVRLLQAGARKKVKDTEGRYPSEVARSQGHMEIAALLHVPQETTEGPSTTKSPTMEPSTERRQPATLTPDTEILSTLRPTTRKPTTRKPTTRKPATTNKPVTIKRPAVPAPTTKKPTTEKPADTDELDSGEVDPAKGTQHSDADKLRASSQKKKPQASSAALEASPRYVVAVVMYLVAVLVVI